MERARFAAYLGKMDLCLKHKQKLHRLDEMREEVKRQEQRLETKQTEREPLTSNANACSC